MNNNPLKQYFRRPAVYIKLPSGGKGYTDADLEMPESGELPVYSMTAIDEITVRTPDGLYNGVAVVEIVKSCVPSIKNPWNINSMDLETILLSIRAASGNGKLNVDTRCPKCNNEATYNIEIPALLASMKAGNYDEELAINDLFIKFTPIKFKQINDASVAQFELTKLFSQMTAAISEDEKLKISQQALKSITELTMEIVAKGISYIRTPDLVVSEQEFILDYLKNCDKTVYSKIRDHSTKLKSQTEIKPMNITCDSCQHKYEQPIILNPSDFFG